MILESGLIQLSLFSIIGIVVMLLSLFLGQLLYNVKLANPIASNFLNSFLGTITIICLYSICIVGYRSVNSIALVVLFYLVYENKERFRIARPVLKDLWPMVYIFFIVFLVYGSYTLPSSIENDVRYYSKIAYSLAEMKQENFYHFYNGYDQAFHGIVTYHYTELWLCSLFNKVFGIKAIISLKYMVYPFLIGSVCYGALGVITGNRFLFFVLFFCITAFPIFEYISIIDTGYPVYTDFWLRPNYTMYYYSLLPLFYMIKEKRWKELTLLSVIVCTTSLIIIPCVISGIIAVLAYAFFKKELSRAKTLLYMAITILPVLCIYIMMKLFGSSVNVISDISIAELLKSTLALWKPVVFISVVLILECGLLLLVSYLVNRLLLKDKTMSVVHVFVFMQVVAGVVLFQVLNQLDNTYQFPYIAYSACGLLVLLALIMAIDRLKSAFFKYGTAVVIIAGCLYITGITFDKQLLSMTLEKKNISENNISDDMAVKLGRFFEENKSAKGGFVNSVSDLKQLPPKSRNCLTFQLGSFIAYYTDNCNLPSLTHKDTLLFDKTPENSKQYTKTEKWQQVFPKYTHRADVTEYLKMQELDFFICSKSKVFDPDGLSVITDSASQYQLVYRIKK